MLFAYMDNSGALIIRVTEPIERYALEAWEAKRQRGKAVLKIETGRTWTINELTVALGKDIAAFQKWQDEQRQRGVVLEMDRVGENVAEPREIEQAKSP